MLKTIRRLSSRCHRNFRPLIPAPLQMASASTTTSQGTKSVLNLFNSSLLLTGILLPRPHNRDSEASRTSMLSRKRSWGYKTSSFFLPYPWYNFHGRTSRIEPSARLLIHPAVLTGEERKPQLFQAIFITPAPIGLVGPAATLDAATR